MDSLDQNIKLMNKQTITFLIKCNDRKGLVAEITNFFYKEGFNILSCQQHVNKFENKYFMRIHLQAEGLLLSNSELEDKFNNLSRSLEISWSVNYESIKNHLYLKYLKSCLFFMDLTVSNINLMTFSRSSLCTISTVVCMYLNGKEIRAEATPVLE